MPRISQINSIVEADLSQAIEWFTGDFGRVSGVILDADGNPYDLSSVSLSVSVEFYQATISTGIGRGASLSITNLVQVVRPRRDLTAAIVQPQSENRGRYYINFPEDLYSGDQPAADLVDNVPCAIGYITVTEQNSEHTVRFFVVFRRGGKGDTIAPPAS